MEIKQLARKNTHTFSFIYNFVLLDRQSVNMTLIFILCLKTFCKCLTKLPETKCEIVDYFFLLNFFTQTPHNTWSVYIQDLKHIHMSRIPFKHLKYTRCCIYKILHYSGIDFYCIYIEISNITFYIINVWLLESCLF